MLFTRAWLLVLWACACGRTDLYELATPAAPIRDAGAPDAGPRDAGLEVIASSLDGLRWELPCKTPLPEAPEYVCVSTPDTVTSTMLLGAPGVRYEVRLRLRGVVETKEYAGATALKPGGMVVRGGTPVDDPWNIYRLDVSSPSQRFHLNQGETGLYLCRVLDEELVLQAEGRALFTLFASTVDGNDSEIRNRDADGGALLVPGVPPFPQAYDGQFIQLDVLSVRSL